ncbi:MAG TPA: transposase [Dehalococcoidia bacterium]|nr:transposase [Dehalococcoidia bacterium]
MNLTLPVKLAPDANQRSALLETVHRFNAACDSIAETAFSEKCANKVALQKLVYYDIREQFGLSAQLTIRAISKVVEAYKRNRSIQPRFRTDGAVPYDERIMSWRRLEAVSLLTLSGRQVIPVRFGEYQAARLDRRKGQADLVLRNGTFFLFVTLDVPEPTEEQVPDYLGVDLGIVNLAVDSDGAVHTGENVERQRRVHSHRRRNLQRKQTRSARRKLRRISGNQKRFQRDTNHVLSKALVRQAKDTNRGIALEDLQGIRQNGKRFRKRQRSRHANWSFLQLRCFIQYKARLVGVPVVLVDPRNTSRTCPACGLVDQANRLSQSQFLCIGCEFAGHADAVAAWNIRARAVVMQPMVPAA